MLKRCRLLLKMPCIPYLQSPLFPVALVRKIFIREGVIEGLLTHDIFFYEECFSLFIHTVILKDTALPNRLLSIQPILQWTQTQLIFENKK